MVGQLRLSLFSYTKIQDKQKSGETLKVCFSRLYEEGHYEIFGRN